MNSTGQQPFISTEKARQLFDYGPQHCLDGLLRDLETREIRPLERYVGRAMVEFSVPYGRGSLALRLPDDLGLEVIQPTPAQAPHDQQGEIQRALSHPLGRIHPDGSSPWAQLGGGGHCFIAVSDNTRPVPYDTILPPLLRWLAKEVGIARSQITWLIGSGGHRPMSTRGVEDLLPRFALDGCRVLVHDARDEGGLRRVGTTSRGTPVWVSRHYLEANVRIVVGNVDPHQFAGFTSGAKGVVIGCGGLATIQANHSLMEHPLSRMGISHGNPVREDIDEAGGLIGIDFALNVVVNGWHEVVRAFAGAVDAVSEESRALSLSLSQAEFEEPADVVIASPGGYPKDIDLYQAQKALAHASHVVRPGGTVVLVAECRDGIGDALFERWMTEASSLGDIIERFRREGFQLGAHKAYLFARDMIRAKVLLVSSLPESLARKFFFHPFSTLSEALWAALAEQGQTARVALLPRASAVVPITSATRAT